MNFPTVGAGDCLIPVSIAPGCNTIAQLCSHGKGSRTASEYEVPRANAYIFLADLMCSVDEMAICARRLQGKIRVWLPLSRKGGNRVKLVNLMALAGRLISNQELPVAAERASLVGQRQHCCKRLWRDGSVVSKVGRRI